MDSDDEGRISTRQRVPLADRTDLNPPAVPPDPDQTDTQKVGVTKAKVHHHGAPDTELSSGSALDQVSASSAWCDGRPEAC